MFIADAGKMNSAGNEPLRILKFHNHREGLPLLLVESTMVGRHEIGADAKVIRNERFGARKILKAVCLFKIDSELVGAYNQEKALVGEML